MNSPNGQSSQMTRNKSSDRKVIGEDSPATAISMLSSLIRSRRTRDSMVSPRQRR